MDQLRWMVNVLLLKNELIQGPYDFLEIILFQIHSSLCFINLFKSNIKLAKHFMQALYKLLFYMFKIT